MEHALQGSGRVTILGSAEKLSRCGSSQYGLAGMVVFSQKLNLMILEVFSGLNDSMIVHENREVKLRF